jgi:DNA-binding IclR family transcriptional regulator
MFSLPAMALGLIFAYLVNTLTCFAIFKSVMEKTSYDIDDGALALGITIGLIMPLISNILPIMRALSKTLRDSLDLFQRVYYSYNMILKIINHIKINF